MPYRYVGTLDENPSENDVMSSLGYNSLNEFTPQINLLFFFALDKRMPAYFRLLPSSVRDISSFVPLIKKSGVKNVVLIGERGFIPICRVEQEQKTLEKDDHMLEPFSADRAKCQ